MFHLVLVLGHNSMAGSAEQVMSERIWEHLKAKRHRFFTSPPRPALLNVLFLDRIHRLFFWVAVATPVLCKHPNTTGNERVPLIVSPRCARAPSEDVIPGLG